MATVAPYQPNNVATLPLSAAGAISFSNARGAVDVVVDLVGYYDERVGDLFVPVWPNRSVDSRVGLSWFGPPAAHTWSMSICFRLASRWMPPPW